MAQFLYAVSTIHTLLCPYTKVEESFNLQAAHDILYFRLNFSQYDHHEFPGVVPRSFIGPLYMSALSAPLVTIFQLSGINKSWSQYVVRMTLALCVIAAWSRLRAAVQKQFGGGVAWWFTLVSVTQYHFMFYMSRPLPNIVVMPLVLLAMEGWLLRRRTQFIVSAGAAIIIFRAELALLFGIFLMMDLAVGKISIIDLLKIAAPAAFGLIGLTVMIDSLMWRRLVWPEAEVFYFNTILNKSSEWGTSPFLWYFYSALPRGLGPSLVLLPLGMFWERRTNLLAVPALAYVLAFSLLPHKELRFIIYVFPLLNIASAAACNFLFTRRRKNPKYELMFLCAILCVVGNVALSAAFLSVATTNYPGGVAITRFHKHLKDEQFVHVHICNLAAQTGVTRFMQSNEEWRYSKNESLLPEQLLDYTHLIVEAKSKYSPNLKPFMRTHTILDSVESFWKIEVSYKTIPPVKIKTKPALFILQRNNFRESPHGLEKSEIPYDGELAKDILEISDEIEHIVEDEQKDLESAIEKEITEVLPNGTQQEVLEIMEEPIQIDQEDQDQGEESEDPQKLFENIKTLRRERKQKAIEKIKSETRKSVIASAKEKLREIMHRHKHIADEILKTETPPSVDEETLIQSENERTEKVEDKGELEIKFDVEIREKQNEMEEHLVTPSPPFSEEIHRNENVDLIVEEVINRLIERRIYDDKTKPEDITAEDRVLIQQIVEEVVAEKMTEARTNNDTASL